MTEIVHSNKRKSILIMLSCVVLLLGAIAFSYDFFTRNSIYTDDAYVNGNSVQLMSQVAGTIMSINTDDTQLVEQGQVLIQLDPTDTQIALTNAAANLANTVRQVKQLFESGASAQASLNVSETQLKKAQLDVERRKIYWAIVRFLVKNSSMFAQTILQPKHNIMQPYIIFAQYML